MKTIEVKALVNQVVEHHADDLFGGLQKRLDLYIHAKNNHELTSLPDGMIRCHPKNLNSLEEQIRRSLTTWPEIPVKIHDYTTRFPYAGLRWYFHSTTEQTSGMIQIP